MAVPDWPSGVPYDPNREDFQPVKRLLDPIRTEMDGGNLRQRSRPGDNVGTLQQSVLMTYAQHDTFMTWVKDTIGNATGRFNMSVWLGSAFSTKVCQFNSVPVVAYTNDTHVVVQMSLRVYGL